MQEDGEDVEASRSKKHRSITEREKAWFRKCAEIFNLHGTAHRELVKWRRMTWPKSKI